MFAIPMIPLPVGGFTQQLGRGMRLYEGKESLIVQMKRELAEQKTAQKAGTPSRY